MGKETIIHIDHHLLQYLQAQSKIQQTRHYKWMGFLRQFYPVIKYKKGNTNRLVDMCSRPPTSNIKALGTLMPHDAIMSPFLDIITLQTVMPTRVAR
jgi:hypothetical protein